MKTSINPVGDERDEAFGQPTARLALAVTTLRNDIRHDLARMIERIDGVTESEEERQALRRGIERWMREMDGLRDGWATNEFGHLFDGEIPGTTESAQELDLQLRCSR